MSTALEATPPRYACYASDTSGVDDGAEPVSIAITTFHRDCALSIEVLSQFDGLQEPINPVSDRASAIHGLSDRDLAGRAFDMEALGRALNGVDALFAWHPRFEKKMLDRLLAEPADLPWHTMRPLSLLPPAPTTPVDGLTRARARVDHMLQCLATKIELGHGDGPLWLDDVLSQPALDEPRPPPEFVIEGNAKFDRLFHGNLADSLPGHRFTLWTKPTINFIVAYNRSGPYGGPGPIFHLLKSKNRKLAAHMAAGGWVEGVVKEAVGNVRRVHIAFP